MQRLTDSRIEAAVRARAADIEVSRELAFAASDVVEAASLGSGPLATAEPGPPTSKRPQPEPMISTADKSAASSPENAKGVVLLAGAVAAAGVAAVAAPSPASLRWLRGLVGLSLFTRLRRDDVLNHPRRNEIYEFVRQNPGERLEVARRVTGLSTGVFLHHISILERQDVVRVHRIEGATRLYLAGPRVQPAPYVPRVRRLMLAQLGTTPGLSQGELASAFGMSARAVSYHISWLHRHSLVDVRRDGRLKRCFALETPRTP